MFILLFLTEGDILGLMFMFKTVVNSLGIAFLSFLFAGCGSAGFISKKNSREVYLDKLSKKDKALAAAMRSSASFALEHPLPVSAPYTETGIFTGEHADATGFYFKVKAGQKVTIHIERPENSSPTVYTELFDASDVNKPRLLRTADTSFNFIEYTASETGAFILRIQPALQQKGKYNLEILISPALGFPVEGRSNVGSVWGDARDGGKRRHEGIDIMAKKGSPVLAVADGVIDYVEYDELGGKVISLKPTGKNYSVYYAHLDEQLVADGQKVKKGQKIGTVGNTGNARNTVPHLHFGIYLKNGAAIDPLPFVQKQNNPVIEQDYPLNKWYQVSTRTKLYPSPVRKNAYDMPVTIKLCTESYTKDFYRVRLENGAKAFVAIADIAGN